MAQTAQVAQEGRDTEGKRNAAGMIRWLLAILLLVALSGVLLTRIHSANQTVTQATTAEATLSATAVHTGQIAPNFTLPPLSGPSARAVSLSDLRGHVVVVNFWSPTCAPCRDEAPILAHASRDDAANGVIFLGVAFEGAPADVVSFLRQYHIPYTCGLDSGFSIATAYGLLALPVTVIVDSAGIVARVIQGAVSSSSLSEGVRTALDQPT